MSHDAARIRKARRAQRTWREIEEQGAVRARFVRELNALALRDPGPIRADVAANWTLTAPPAPDALIDVWAALDDWLEAGKPEPAPRLPDGSSPRGDTYVRLVTCLTRFDFYLRGAVG